MHESFILCMCSFCVCTVLFICIQRSQLAQSTDSVIGLFITRKMDAHGVTSMISLLINLMYTLIYISIYKYVYYMYIQVRYILRSPGH